MIDFHYWPTPNGWKVSIMLEECGLPYRVVPVNIGKGDQFKPEFLAISPNNRMPAIVDHDADGETVPVFEIGRHPAAPGGEVGPLHAHRPARAEGDAGVAVLAGRQSRADGRTAQPFRQLRAGRACVFAPALRRRVQSLPGRAGAAAGRARVHPRRLFDRRHGIVSLGADLEAAGSGLDEFPNVARWREAIKQRPAVQRGVDLGKELRRRAPPGEEERRILFNQTAKHPV